MISEKDLRQNIAMSMAMCDSLRTNNFKVNQAVMRAAQQHVTDKGSHQRDIDTVRQFLNGLRSDGWPVLGRKLLAVRDASGLIQMMRDGKGGLILREVLGFKTMQDTEDPIRDFRIFTLALLSRYKVMDHLDAVATGLYCPMMGGLDELVHSYWLSVQQTAFKSSWKVLSHSPAMFLFVRYCEQISKNTSHQRTGWGRSMKKTIQNWYLRRIPDDLCAEIVTYPKGYAGFKHRDMLRLAHPNPAKSCAFATKKATKMTYAYDIIFCYACTGKIDLYNHFAESLSAWNPPTYEITPEMVFEAKGTNAIAHLVKLDDQKRGIVSGLQPTRFPDERVDGGEQPMEQ